MFCADLADLEQLYFATLGEVQTIERTEAGLVLTGPAGTLDFEPMPELDPADLWSGRTWTLDAVLDADGTRTPAVGEAELMLADDGTYRLVDAAATSPAATRSTAGGSRSTASTSPASSASPTRSGVASMQRCSSPAASSRSSTATR